MQKMHDTCTVAKCERAHHARGFCATHYAQHKRGMPPTPVINARQMVKPEACSYEGCQSPVKSKGLCAAHYQHKLRHGHTRYQDRKRPWRPCLIPGCPDNLYAKGMCHRHHIKERKWRSFGVTVQDYLRMFSEQDGKCLICSKPETARDGLSGRVRDFAIDHCHTTNVVRGLLCSNCNTAIGLLQDDPELLLKAAAYLHRFSKS